MRIIHLTPGTGTFHCGSCLRDSALVKALRARGHDVLMAPLYLPLVLDRDAPSATAQPVQVGGISLYLQQKMPWFHRMPRFIHRWLNDPDRLRKASLRMGMTSAKALGEMTLDSLRGDQGRQWPEWKKLVAWLREQPKTDVISLSNSLLTGLAPTISQELGITVICSLQGEDAFLDTLPEPYRQQAWDEMRENARHVTRFIAPSQFYARAMMPRLDVNAEKMVVVPNGIDVTPFSPSKPDPNFPVLGYLARMIHGKGLTTLVDAFIMIVRGGKLPRLKLKVAGAMTPADEAYVAGLKKKLDEAGCAARAEFLPNIDFDDKTTFYRSLSVFSVPATYGEAFGLPVIEAMACGVPVVQPDSGAFPEIIAATGGGVIVKPDDASALAAAVEDILLDQQLREKLSNQGMQRVRSEFTATSMAARFDEMLQTLPAKQP